MTEPAHDNFIEQFSDYHDGSLATEATAELKAHLQACESCRAEYDSFRKALDALSGLHKMSAPDSLGDEVEETIRRRSGGRFFGPKGVLDRLPLRIIGVIALALGLAAFLFIKCSDTGSLKLDEDPEPPSKNAP